MCELIIYNKLLKEEFDISLKKDITKKIIKRFKVFISELDIIFISDEKEDFFNFLYLNLFKRHKSIEIENHLETLIQLNRRDKSFSSKLEKAYRTNNIYADLI